MEQKHFSTKLMSLLVLISFTFTISCTTKKSRPIHTTTPQEKVEGINAGDTVKVTTYSGQRYKFKVERISNEVIEGGGIQIAIIEIDSIKKDFGTGKTVALVVGIIAVIVALILIVPESDLHESQHNRD